MSAANFRKVRNGAGAHYYAAEAADCSGSRLTKIPIPKIHAVGDAALELDRIVETSPSAVAAENFGRALALPCIEAAHRHSGWVPGMVRHRGGLPTCRSLYGSSTPSGDVRRTANPSVPQVVS